MGHRQIGRRISRMLILAAATVWPVAAGAAEVVWDNGAGSSLWTNPINWAGDVKPGAIDTAVFNTGFGTVSLGNITQTVYELDLSPPAGTYTYSQGSLAVSRIVQTAGDVTVPLSLSAPGLLEVNVADSRLTVTGNLYTTLLLKRGNGELVINSGTASMTTNAVIQEGTVTVASPNAMQSWIVALEQATLNLQGSYAVNNGTITADPGAHINITGSSGGTGAKIILNPGAALNVCNLGLSSSAATISLKGGATTITGSTGGTFSVDSSSTITVDEKTTPSQGIISGLTLNTATLTVASSGGTQGLKVSGSTTVSTGASAVLVNNTPADLGTMTLNGTFKPKGPAATTISSLTGTSGLFQIDDPIAVSIGNINNAFGRAALNAGTLTVTNVSYGVFDIAAGATLVASNPSSGAKFNLKGGLLSLRNDSSLGSGATVELFNDSRIDVGPKTSATGKYLGVDTLTLPDVTLTVDGSSGYSLLVNTLSVQGTGNAKIVANAPATLGTINGMQKPLTIDNAAAVTINWLSSGYPNASLTKLGSGKLTIGSNGSNAFLGPLLLKGGETVFTATPFTMGTIRLTDGATLTLQNSNAQGTNAITAEVGTTVALAYNNALSTALTRLNDATLRWQKNITTSGGQLAVSGNCTVLLPSDEVSTTARSAGSLLMYPGTLSVTGNNAIPVSFSALTVDSSAIAASPAKVANASAVTFGSTSTPSQINGVLIHNGSAALTLGQLHGVGTVRQDSTGLLTVLSGSSYPSPSFTGELAIDSGAVSITQNYGIVGGTIRMAANTQLTLAGIPSLSGTNILTDTGSQVLVNIGYRANGAINGGSITLAPGATLTTTSTSGLGFTVPLPVVTLAGGSIVNPVAGYLFNVSADVTADSLNRSDCPTTSDYEVNVLTLGDSTLTVTGSAITNNVSFNTATISGTGKAVLNNNLRLAVNTLTLNKNLAIEGTGDVNITTLAGAGTLTSNTTGMLTLNMVNATSPVLVNKGSVKLTQTFPTVRTIVLADGTAFTAPQFSVLTGWKLQPTGGTLHSYGDFNLPIDGGLSPLADTTVILDRVSPIGSDSAALTFVNLTLPGVALALNPGTATNTSLKVTTLQTTGTAQSVLNTTLKPTSPLTAGATITNLNLGAPLKITGSSVVSNSNITGQGDLTIEMDPAGIFAMGSANPLPWTGSLIVRSGTATLPSSITTVLKELQLYGGTATLNLTLIDHVLLTGGTLRSASITSNTINSLDMPAGSAGIILGASNCTFYLNAMNLQQGAALGLQSIPNGQLSGPISCASGSAFNIVDSTLSLKSDPGSATAMNLALSASGSSSITLSAPAHLQSLSLAGSSYLSATTGQPTPVLIHLNTLAMEPFAAVDIQDGTLITDPTPAGHQAALDQIHAYLVTGALTHYWRGYGICSTAAANDITNTHTLGLLDNAVAGLSAFAGDALTAQSIIVRYTLYGDADLDGLLTVADFEAFLAGAAATDVAAGQMSVAAASGPYWYIGNFNYDGTVDGADLNLFLDTYLKANVLAYLPDDFAAQLLAGIEGSGLSDAQKSQFSQAVAAVVLPEPGAVLGAASLAMLLVRRQRRPQARIPLHAPIAS